MKFSKKLTALLLSASMVFALAACGGPGGTSPSPSGSGSPTPSDSTSPSPSSSGATPLKIAIVTSPNTVDDGSFNEDNYDGILNFIAARGDIDSVTPVQESTGDPSAAVQAVTDIVADYDVLVCTGFQFAGIATPVGLKKGSGDATSSATQTTDATSSATQTAAPGATAAADATSSATESGNWATQAPAADATSSATQAADATSSATQTAAPGATAAPEATEAPAAASTIDAISGATITSTAVVNGVNQCAAFIKTLLAGGNA